jgi:hypothetical protein
MAVGGQAGMECIASDARVYTCNANAFSNVQV